jgi:uncharacterized protein
MKGPTLRLSAMALALAAALLGAPPAAAEIEVPFLSGRIVDLAEMISPAAEQRLEVELESLEEANGAQLAILTVPTLDGEAIETYALRVAEAWKLGQEKQDNGVLLLIARDDRKMRIEVGYGLEGAIPDAIAKRILAERLTPRFQAGDFDGGITDAVNTIGGLARGEPGALPPKKKRGRGFNPVNALFVLAIVMTSLIWPAIHSKKFNWTMYSVLAVPSFLLPKMIAGSVWGLAGLGAWLVLFPLLRMIAPHLPKPGEYSTSRSSGGTWWIGGGGGGRSSGGGWGGGGGGFSGGGGSFGGGGASGSW